MTPTTKPFNGTEDDTLPIDILPDDSSSATTTTIPTRQTAMEGEMQWFLSLPHEERHAIHLANPFAIPNDMNEWVNDNLRTRPPSPPSHTQTGNRARWSPPPQAQHESFFEDLYERTMDARKSATSSHPEESAEESRAAPEPAMITAPFPPGIPVPPRVPSIFPLATSEIEPTMYEKVMRQPPSRTTTPQPQNYCIQPDCPIAPLRHPQGRYLHNDRLAPNHLPTFSTSNPPPHIWQAIHNGTLGIGTQHDANIISKFLAYHVRFCNFSVVPDTNFIWGHEIHSRGMDVVRRPFVRLPFPVTPLRVRFDAGPNLDGDGREGGGEGEGMEGVLFDGVVDEDDDGRREVVRRRILAL
ncbi:MAG: hypothetical protein L6R36_006031 [Xanthoria steineri]|nr:MAG: hypothetical protein L6R36_006031 [Xanthoria steineri]